MNNNRIQEKITKAGKLLRVVHGLGPIDIERIDKATNRERQCYNCGVIYPTNKYDAEHTINLCSSCGYNFYGISWSDDITYKPRRLRVRHPRVEEPKPESLQERESRESINEIIRQERERQRETELRQELPYSGYITLNYNSNTGNFTRNIGPYERKVLELKAKMKNNTQPTQNIINQSVKSFTCQVEPDNESSYIGSNSIFDEVEESNSDDDSTCVFCLDIITENDTLTTKCNHKFHTGCYFNYINTSVKTTNLTNTFKCPICRNNLL